MKQTGIKSESYWATIIERLPCETWHHRPDISYWERYK
jgi:hypothetical protein